MKFQEGFMPIREKIVVKIFRVDTFADWKEFSYQRLVKKSQMHRGIKAQLASETAFCCRMREGKIYFVVEKISFLTSNLEANKQDIPKKSQIFYVG